MAIILEGFDNSGKSTLAASFGLDVVHPGPRPSSLKEENSCLSIQRRRCRQPIVMDRITAISTPCYTGNFDSRYIEAVEAMLYTPQCVMIYCRPPLENIVDFSNHVIKSYDDDNKLTWLKANSHIIVARYDEYMRRFPHMVYDYTNPDQSVIDLAKDATLNIEGWRKWTSLTPRQLQLI